MELHEFIAKTLSEIQQGVQRAIVVVSSSLKGRKSRDVTTRQSKLNFFEELEFLKERKRAEY